MTGCARWGGPLSSAPPSRRGSSKTNSRAELTVPAETPDGEGRPGRRPEAQVDQAPGREGPDGVGVLQHLGERLDREQVDQVQQPGRQAAEGGVEDTGNDGDGQEA